MAVYDLIRFGTRVLMGAIARVTVKGAEHLARPGGYILASNHLSAWDPPFILSITPPRPKLTVLAAAKWQKVAPLRLIFDAMDAIYLRQGDADRGALKAALALLKAGGTIGMSPEGTRSRTGALIRARSGVAWLALRANTPIVPVAIFANLVRVLILILLTYHAGEAAAQGFLHNFAGMTTFAIALVSIYVFDQLCQKITGRRAPGRAV